MFLNNFVLIPAARELDPRGQNRAHIHAVLESSPVQPTSKDTTFESRTLPLVSYQNTFLVIYCQLLAAPATSATVPAH